MEIGRLDYDINTKHRLYARYFFGLYNQPVPPDPSNALNTNGVAQYDEDSSVTIGDTYTFTANLINAAHVPGRRTVGHRTVDLVF